MRLTSPPMRLTTPITFSPDAARASTPGAQKNTNKNTTANRATILWRHISSITSPAQELEQTPPAEMMQACPSFEKSVRISSGGGGSKQKEGKKEGKKRERQEGKWKEKGKIQRQERQ
mmetsp:Transcript_89552/g.178995  ORF Transcript_89552/g.178995 Transcript_89552/m.178995 type:complete len:118 (-) Transcript_89552:41-394(-)